MSVVELAQVGAGLGVLVVAVAAYIGLKTINAGHRTRGLGRDEPTRRHNKEREQ